MTPVYILVEASDDGHSARVIIGTSLNDLIATKIRDDFAEDIAWWNKQPGGGGDDAKWHEELRDSLIAAARKFQVKHGTGVTGRYLWKHIGPDKGEWALVIAQI